MSLKSYQSFKNPVNFSFWRISMTFLHNVVLYKHSLKNIFWQFSYPYGYLIYEVTTYYYGRTIQLQILLMVFKCYIWGLPWKNYGISIFFQSQKWIRLVIKQLLPKIHDIDSCIWRAQWKNDATTTFGILRYRSF